MESILLVVAVAISVEFFFSIGFVSFFFYLPASLMAFLLSSNSLAWLSSSLKAGVGVISKSGKRNIIEPFASLSLLCSIAGGASSEKLGFGLTSLGRSREDESFAGSSFLS